MGDKEEHRASSWQKLSYVFGKYDSVKVLSSNKVYSTI